MKQRTSFIMSALLLFVFVFTMFVTLQAEAPHDCSKTPCDEYDCCYIDYSAIHCLNKYGVWYQGECHCDWTGDNPNSCLITGCYPLECQ